MANSPKKPADEARIALGPSNFRAFTMKADRLLRQIRFDIGITRSIPGDKGVPQSQLKQYSAILDTAANRTRISREVIKAANLQLGGNNGCVTYYYADIYLPNMIRFTEVPVTEIPEDFEFGADCLIGMDILSCADCSLSHKDKKMMFSLRVPPLGGTDFVEEHQRLYEGKKKMVTTAATRNQPCPCGSGKRFKNCCGKLH